MTVSDLIEYLKRYAGDTPVYLSGADAPDTGEYIALDHLPLETK